MSPADKGALTVATVALVLALLLLFLTGCSTWTSCADPYADYPGCGDREG